MNRFTLLQFSKLTVGMSVALKPVLQVRRSASVADTRARPTAAPATAGSSSTSTTHRTACFKIKHGPRFTGKSFGATSNASGEVVFTTSLVGYPESMTDASYRGQILVFTQPLIGNYGVPSVSDRDRFGLLRHFESSRIQASGVIVGDVALQYSHWTAVESLGQWCAREGVPGVSGVDTREIVTYLRERGSCLGRITVGKGHDKIQNEDERYDDPANLNLVSHVSTKTPTHTPAIDTQSASVAPHIALLDCGVKENIIRSLAQRGASVTCLPHDYPIHNHVDDFDGILISNGPGDPTNCKTTIQNLRELLRTTRHIPIMGICLGHQLLAIAAGAKTCKMKYGNRAHNIPVIDLTTGKCYITSQNHGYVVDSKTLPPEFKSYFININDGSNEGIIHQSRPIFTTQFHPEAKGGPQDANYLFDVYLRQVQQYQHNSRIHRNGR